MCPEQKYLSAYFDGETEGAIEHKIREHVEHCAVCQKTLQEMQTLQTLLKADPPPEHRKALRRFQDSLTYIQPRPNRFWRRRVNLSLPLATVAAVLFACLSISLAIVSTRSQFRQMSIKRAPSGVTEIQVAAPIEDLEMLLKSLDANGFKQEIIIMLPEETRFIIVGEPEMVREADYSARVTQW